MGAEVAAAVAASSLVLLFAVVRVVAAAGELLDVAADIAGAEGILE